MIIRKTRKDEWKRVNELFSIAFEEPLSNAPAKEEEPRSCHWAAYQDDGSMMSTLTVADYTISFDGHSAKMGGIGGVATLPPYRRLGGIRGCFEACLPELYEKNYLFSYLYAFSNAYYRKFGYESCVQKLAMEVDLSLLKPSAVSGSCVLCEADRPCQEAIREIDSLWEAKYNMMVLHSQEDYGWTEKFDPAGTLRFTYVYFSSDRTPKAYTSFRMENQPDGRNLLCSRFFFTDREGFQGLMNLFKSMAADHRYVKFELPAACHMEYLLPEWSLNAARWRVQTAGMVRVINAAAVLRKAAYRGSGQLTVAIADPLISQNNDCFRVVFRDSQAQSVSPGASEPDVTMTIGAFSALMAGTGALEWISGVTVHNPDAPLSQVFFQKPMMIADFF